MLTSLLLTAALASPDTPEELPRLDVSAFMDELVILDDGSGHQIAYRASAPRESIWYGEKGSFYQLDVYSSSSNGDTTWSVGATDRRVWDGVGVFRKGGALGRKDLARLRQHVEVKLGHREKAAAEHEKRSFVKGFSSLNDLTIGEENGSRSVTLCHELEGTEAVVDHLEWLAKELQHIDLYPAGCQGIDQ